MISVQLPKPPTVNQLYANVPGKGRVKTARYRTWLNAAGWDLKAARCDRIAGPVAVHYLVPDSARFDGANLEKAISDLLVEHELIDDDRYIKDYRITKTLPGDAKHVIVRVWRYGANDVSEAA